MDGEVSNLGMVQWVLSNFDVACVVAMYGMIDTLVMLNSTNKSKKPLSFFCSFHECYKFGLHKQQGHIILFFVKLHVIEVPLNENKCPLINFIESISPPQFVSVNMVKARFFPLL